MRSRARNGVVAAGMSLLGLGLAGCAPSIGGLRAPTKAEESHPVKCGQTVTVFSNPAAGKRTCFIANYSDLCPTTDSEVTITGHPGHTSVPNNDDISLSLGVDPGKDIKFTCKGTPDDNPNNCCAWELQYKGDLGPGEECRAP